MQGYGAKLDGSETASTVILRSRRMCPNLSPSGSLPPFGSASSMSRQEMPTRPSRTQLCRDVSSVYSSSVRRRGDWCTVSNGGHRVLLKMCLCLKMGVCDFSHQRRRRAGDSNEEGKRVRESGSRKKIQLAEASHADRH
jgi:hypothetical protein